MRLREGVSKTDILLVVLGCIVLTLYRLGLSANKPEEIGRFITIALVQSAIFVVAALIVIRARPSRTTLLIVIVFGVVFRLSILFFPPYLSDDIYRYIWDGRVQAAGVNPYRYVPAAPELAHLRDDTIYPRINRREHARTIYPPLAEGLFLATTRISESVVCMKITMVGFEIIAAWAIVQLLASLGLPRQRLLIYAWHPLVVWELAGSGHVDSMAIAFICLALLAFQRKSDIAAGFALAGATLIKLFPVVLLPALFKRGRWRIAVVLAAAMLLAYVPYLSVGPKAMLGSLPGYAQERGLVSGEQFYLLHLARKLFGPNLPSGVFVGFAALVLGAIAGWATLRKKQSEDHLRPAMILATALIVLFAPHFTWYFAWLIPFLCFTTSVAVFYLTIASFVLYFTWLGDSPDRMFIINSIIYLPFFIIGTIEFLGRKEERSTQGHTSHKKGNRFLEKPVL